MRAAAEQRAFRDVGFEGFGDDVCHTFAVKPGLAGSARFSCRGKPGLGAFRSNWQDTGSLRPVFSGLSFGVQNNLGSLTLQAQGAQSQKQALGTGTGVVDTANVSALVTPTGTFIDGWRFWRHQGSFTRLNATSPAPQLDNLAATYTTDQ